MIHLVQSALTPNPSPKIRRLPKTARRGEGSQIQEMPEQLRKVSE